MVEEVGWKGEGEEVRALLVLEGGGRAKGERGGLVGEVVVVEDEVGFVGGRGRVASEGGGEGVGVGGSWMGGGFVDAWGVGRGRGG